MALEFVMGKPRRGKTSYVVAKVIDMYMNYVNNNYYEACSYIKSLNKNLNLALSLPPQRHVVSANFDISTTYPNMSSYHISGFEFGVPNKYCKTKPLIPYGVYVFDECQKYFDSKGDKELPPWVTQAFELRGHIFLEIFLIAQRLKRLNIDIRETVDVFTYIDESIHEYIVNGVVKKSKKFLSYGKLVKTTFYGRQFEDEWEVEEYLKGNKKVGKPFKYVFKGDIKSHYNPHSYATVVEDYSKDFEYNDYSEIITERPSEWDNFKKKIKKE